MRAAAKAAHQDSLERVRERAKEPREPLAHQRGRGVQKAGIGTCGDTVCQRSQADELKAILLEKESWGNQGGAGTMAGGHRHRAVGAQAMDGRADR